MVLGALLVLTALAACLLTPLLCAALYLGAQLASSRLPPPKAAPAQDIDFPRAVVSLLLWYAIACVAASVHAELGFIAACFAVAACVSLPFVDGGHGGNGGGNGGGSSLMLFSLDVLDEPLSVAFLYAMLPLVCTLPLILAGPGAFVHAYLWGHLWWAAARYGSLPNALAASIGIALIVNSFDGFSLLDCAPLAGTLAALPAGKALFRLFRLNKTGFFAGVVLSSLVSSSVRVVLATLVTTSLTLAATAVASTAAALQQSGLPATLVAMGGAAAAAISGGAAEATGGVRAAASAAANAAREAAREAGPSFAGDVGNAATTPYTSNLPIPAYPR